MSGWSLLRTNTLILEEMVLDQLDRESRKEVAVRRSFLESLKGSFDTASEAHSRALLLDRPWESEKGAASLTANDLIKMYADKFPKELKND